MTDIPEQQIEYYRARAAEYDEWFYRQGRYDRGEENNHLWFKEAEQVREALLALPKQGHILELAAGTGIWTLELLKIAEQITIVDASPEMLAINQAKHNAPNVTTLRADLFEWQPIQEYDMIYFGFWLSHVPPERSEFRDPRLHHLLDDQADQPIEERSAGARASRHPGRRDAAARDPRRPE